MTNEESPTSADSPASHVSPLRNILIEFHEIHQELLEVGFHPSTASQILATMLLEVVLYRDDGDVVEIRLESEEDEEDEEDPSDGEPRIG